MAYLVNTEEGKELLAEVRRFCEKEIKEQCKEYDKSGEYPAELYKKVMDMQLHILELPEEFGGPGLDRVTCAALLEQLAMADAGIATAVSASALALKCVLMAGTTAQKERVAALMLGGSLGAFCLTEPAAGSDAAATKTTAVRDGDDYVLNGRKTFITNGSTATYYTITAKTDKSAGTKGISMFLVEKGTKGLSSGNHEDKLGVRTSETCDVVLEDCRVPASALIGPEGKGFSVAMKGLDQARSWIGCIAVGIAQRAIDEAVAYGKQRIQFGRPLTDNQGIRFKLADMVIRTESARQTVAHALTLMDLKLPCGTESAVAKAYAGDVAMEVASEAIQIFGGYGYSKEYPVEKLLRDAKIFQIFEGANEIQKIVISSNLLGK